MNREDLKNYRATQEWIKGRIEYIESYKSTINKLTSSLSDTFGGRQFIQDREAEKLAKLLDSVDDLMDTINKENEKQMEILKMLDKVEQPYKNILDKHYIQGKRLLVIANEMYFSYERIKKLNSKALHIFEELWETEEEKAKRLKSTPNDPQKPF